MTWEIAITLAAIGLLAVLHAAFQPRAVPPVAEAPPEGGGDESWGRWLALAALAAAVIALAVLIVPAVFGGSSSSTSSTTHVTSTTLPTTTTQPHTTTTHPTTTQPTTTTTTTPPPPPKGSATLVRGTVSGGRLALVQNRLGGQIEVTRVSRGAYRVSLPALSPAARRRSVVRVSAGGRTTVVGGWSPDGQVVVLISDRQTGRQVDRRFSFVVLGPKSKAALPRTL